MSEAESFEGLWAYCTANKRAVPLPLRWRAMFQMLRDARELPSGEWEPPLPLIKHAWSDTTAEQKQLCFRKHVEWASEKGQIEEIGTFLRALSEAEWYHFPEM